MFISNQSQKCFPATRVVDLGVMTPCDKILKSAIEEKAGEYATFCWVCKGIAYLIL